MDPTLAAAVKEEQAYMDIIENIIKVTHMEEREIWLMVSSLGI